MQQAAVHIETRLNYPGKANYDDSKRIRTEVGKMRGKGFTSMRPLFDSIDE
jgi:hypothetical protein